MSRHRPARARHRVLTLAFLAGALATLGACNKNKPTPRARTVEPTITRDIPTALRGTVGSVARLRGVNATRVSGIGFVVGLNGTGGLPLQERIAAHLEREMALQGIGQAGQYSGTAIEGKSPRQLLSDRNTAAVIVEAALPPGAGEGSTFDIYVRALNATSIEGGTLWTTELQPGPPSAFGSRQTRKIAEARGPIFINPFAEPGAEGDGVTRTVGRVLDGGQMLETLYIDIVLDSPSHARSRQIAAAINSIFPRGPGDREPIARGRDESLVRVQVPRRCRDRTSAFAELVRHVTIDQAYPDEYAKRYAAVMRSQPEMASEMSWCLEALGGRSLPFLRDLYDEVDAIPRLAALRAGAHLGDPMAAQPLIDLATSGPAAVRPEAARLLGRLDGGPIIEQTLTDLLGEDDLVVRVAAYEALADRAVELQRRRLLAEASRTPGGATARLSLAALDSLSRTRLPDGTMQRVSRRLVAGKFLLDWAPAGDPLIYVTQQGEPRIALFGEDLSIDNPMLVSAWSDRLLIDADSSGPIRISYMNDRTGRVTRGEVDRNLPALIDFFARRPTPEDPRPGLDLSYSEVVGALYEMQRQGQIAAAFSTERDRLLAELLQAGEKEEITVRPETAEDEGEVVLFGNMDDPKARVVKAGEAPPRRSLLVPLSPDAKAREAGGQTPAPAPTPPAANKDTPMRDE